MKIKVKKNPKFTVGNSYKQHLIDVKNTFDTIVAPQIKSSKKQNDLAQTIILTSEQKAHLNCLSPI